MQPLSSITLRYDGNEDRILVAINAGSPDGRGYWLTRRLALSFIEAANPYLERLSPIVSKTPAELRGELAAMEREVALASTQGALARAPAAALESASRIAELAFELDVSVEPRGFRLRFRGRKGGESSIGYSRAELQRIVHMLEQEAAKAGWRERTPVAALSSDCKEAQHRAN
jgi:hypothetical protein